MAFIISKASTRGGITRKLYYLVSNYRENGKIKRKPILCMGKYTTLEEFKDNLLIKKTKLETQLDEAINQHKIPRIIMIGRTDLLPKRIQLWFEELRSKIEKCDNQITCITTTINQS